MHYFGESLIICWEFLQRLRNKANGGECRGLAKTFSLSFFELFFLINLSLANIFNLSLAAIIFLLLKFEQSGFQQTMEWVMELQSGKCLILSKKLQFKCLSKNGGIITGKYEVRGLYHCENCSRQKMQEL